jgi:heavy metal sensor kinase
MRENVRIRAETLAQDVEIVPDGIDLELAPDLKSRYEDRAWYAIYDARSARVAASPSLGGFSLPPPGPWREGAIRFWRVEDGPGGSPVTVATLCFVARIEDRSGPEDAGWTPPPESERHYTIQVAEDSGEPEEELGHLATFLVVAGFITLLLTTAAGLFLARIVLGPLRRMTQEAAALTPQDPGRRLDPDTVVSELHSLANTLNHALDRLADALDRQRRFTTDASHELRTPVSILLGNSELLLRRPRSPEEYREGLERQHRTALRMKEITENLLTLSRADAAPGGIRLAPVDLAGTVRTLVGDFQAIAREHGIDLEYEAPGALEIRGDASALQHLVSNLLSNAVKFTPESGRVAVRLDRAGDDAVLTVADTGTGIPAEHLSHLFERFYRVRDGTDEREGAGLGLAIVDWAVRAHQGAIGVESTPDRGTTFTVRLPLVPRAR